MNTDRRSYDPYAPASSGGSAEPSDGEPEPEEWGPLPDDVHESSGEDVESDGLDAMRRVDLLTLAESEGVAAYGNRESLIARIRKHRQSQA